MKVFPTVIKNIPFFNAVRVTPRLLSSCLLAAGSFISFL